MVYLRTYGFSDNTCSEQNFEVEYKIICDGSTPTNIEGNNATCTKAGNNVTLLYYNGAYIVHTICGECNYGAFRGQNAMVVCSDGQIAQFQTNFRDIIHINPIIYSIIDSII